MKTYQIRLRSTGVIEKWVQVTAENLTHAESLAKRKAAGTDDWELNRLPIFNMEIIDVQEEQ